MEEDQRYRIFLPTRAIKLVSPNSRGEREKRLRETIRGTGVGFELAKQIGIFNIFLFGKMVEREKGRGSLARWPLLLRIIGEVVERERVRERIIRDKW